ncbi:MAG: nucleoside kinase [Ruminococcaceae bacterium]|nr:nucleoside kinase [Oscillospiraceae bacterium]
MKLTINGCSVTLIPGQSLLDIIQKMKLVTEDLSTNPLAAKIAGDVFTLNYIPLREKDATPVRESKRKAMAASGGCVRLLTYRDPAGREVYDRTARFALFLALRQLWPHARAVMNFTLGQGLHVKVTGAEDFSAEVLKSRLMELVKEDIPLIRRRISTEDAIRYYLKNHQNDKARLLKYRPVPTFDVYEYDGFADYYYGEMAPSTGYLKVWDILPAEDGFVFVYPNPHDPDRVATYRHMPNYYQVYREGKQWGELMQCETVADLNELVDTGKIRELIRVNEALHEKRYGQVADMICRQGAKAVMLAGPSSSGKTTSANRLAVQLKIHGKHPILMSLDDYYKNRDEIPVGSDGKVDLEHINTIDTELFGTHLSALLRGEEVEIPTFCFKTGKREWAGHRMRLTEESVIIIEGLHALNPKILPEGLPAHMIFRLFVSPLLPLNLDDHNRVPTGYLRLLRRIVRDFETRNSSVQRTMDMWDSVRRGEEKWIYPFRETADVIFNSATLYELAVLKKHIFPLLTAVQPHEECYDEVRGIVKILNFVHEADVDDEIPPTSLVREFIGGNSFYKTDIH